MAPPLVGVPFLHGGGGRPRLLHALSQLSTDHGELGLTHANTQPAGPGWAGRVQDS